MSDVQEVKVTNPVRFVSAGIFWRVFWAVVFALMCQAGCHDAPKFDQRAIGGGVYEFNASLWPNSYAEFLASHPELRVTSIAPGQQSGFGKNETYVVTTETR